MLATLNEFTLIAPNYFSILHFLFLNCKLNLPDLNPGFWGFGGNFMPMQKGDVPATWADATLLKELTGYAPQTDVREGIAKFVAWYREYYRV